MHQHTGIGNIISMEILDLKVVNNNRLIKKFCVCFRDNSCCAVGKSKDIALTKVFGTDPLIFYPERMIRCCFDLFAVYEDVDKYFRFSAEYSCDFFVPTLPRFGVS